MIKLYISPCTKQNEHDVGARLAAHALLDTYGISAPLKKDARGKPFFEGVGAYISISHSNELCLAAISDSEIGADIEYKNGDDAHLLRIAKRYFTDEEAAYVQAFPSERFFEIWCAKESYIKYTGEGFSRALSGFSVADTGMCFSHFEIDGYAVCVCSKEKCDTPPTLVDMRKNDKE